MISLAYNDGLDGERLRHSDDLTKHRAQIRSNQLTRLGDTRGGYNIINGEARPIMVDPTPPRANPALQTHWMAHA